MSKQEKKKSMHASVLRIYTFRIELTLFEIDGSSCMLAVTNVFNSFPHCVRSRER